MSSRRKASSKRKRSPDAEEMNENEATEIFDPAVEAPKKKPRVGEIETKLEEDVLDDMLVDDTQESNVPEKHKKAAIQRRNVTTRTTRSRAHDSNEPTVPNPKHAELEYDLFIVSSSPLFS